MKAFITEALREKLAPSRLSEEAATYRLPALPERDAPPVTSKLVEELEADLGE